MMRACHKYAIDLGFRSAQSDICSAVVSVNTNSHRQATKRFWPPWIRELIQSKLFILLVPGGGVEPP